MHPMKFVAFAWKLAFGILLCLTPVSALLVLGWLARSMQRATFQSWFHHGSAGQSGRSFRDFVRSEPDCAYLQHWPNWILGQAGAAAGFGRLAGSLWANFRLGVQVLANVWLLTLPACAMWAVAWWGGWESSFNKGYEQAAVGPAIGLIGTVWFLAVMMYLPLAQARQAATGNWKSFYDFGLLRVLARQSRVRHIGLAVLFALAGLIVAGIHAGPLALGNLIDGDPQASAEKTKKIAGLYHLSACAVIFVLVTGLRVAAAKLYARNVRQALNRGAIEVSSLSQTEQDFLGRLEGLEISSPKPAGLVVRTIVGTGRNLAGIGFSILLAAVWFVFVAELYVSQFLNHDWVAWLNLPLVQLPWFHGPG